MNELDQFVKHALRVPYYARYTDDIMVLSESRGFLERLALQIDTFLHGWLRLSLHPDKTVIQSCYRGLDFLGYVVFPHHRLLRSRTRKRILKMVKKAIREYHHGLRSKQSVHQSLQSYLGVLSHADTFKLRRDLRNQFWV